MASLYEGQAVDPRSGEPVDERRPYVNTALVAARPEGWRPADALAIAKALELAAGRRGGPRYGDRPLDVDVLWFGTSHRDDEVLRLPHPGLLLRRFVLAPLAEIDPGMVLPPDGVRADAALAALDEASGPSTPAVVRRPWRFPPLDAVTS